MSDTFPFQPSGMGSFITGVSAIGNEFYSTVQTILPAYPYAQYTDDPYLPAFFTAHNEIAQGYLDWFNQTPLSVWTNSNISGLLLDWIGQGIYGIARPVLSSIVTATTAGLATIPLATQALATMQTQTSGTAQIANDDIYKRCLTWALYLADGKQASLHWLRRRVARFIFGPHGADVAPDYFSQVQVTISGSAVTITAPNNSSGQFFQQCVSSGVLPLPFQLSYTVTLV
ncbi:MAG: hypothetical protein KGL35_16045 [Bradyrhizobium sp.]|nr:hypothetical protein [Bradyrhizobium sp.]